MIYRKLALNSSYFLPPDYYSTNKRNVEFAFQFVVFANHATALNVYEIYKNKHIKISDYSESNNSYERLLNYDINLLELIGAKIL